MSIVTGCAQDGQEILAGLWAGTKKFCLSSTGPGQLWSQPRPHIQWLLGLLPAGEVAET